MDPTSPRNRESPGWGLVLFPPGTPPARRRRRLVFLALYLLATLMVIWPVYGWFRGIHPLVLQLPLSLAWVVLALAVSFGALLWLFLGEESGPPTSSEGN